MLKTIDNYDRYLVSLDGSGATIGLGATIGVSFSSGIKRRRIKTNYTGQHLSLKIQNDSVNSGIRLISLGLGIKKLPVRNTHLVNLYGSHFSLKFQNNEASAPFQLQTLGIDLRESTER